MNKPRISTEHVELVEQLIDLVREARADGQVTAEEADGVQHVLEALVYPSAMEVDDAIGAVLTIGRRGLKSPMAHRRLAEHNLRLIHGGRDGQPEGPRAA